MPPAMPGVFSGDKHDNPPDSPVCYPSNLDYAFLYERRAAILSIASQESYGYMVTIW